MDYEQADLSSGHVFLAMAFGALGYEVEFGDYMSGGEPAQDMNLIVIRGSGRYLSAPLDHGHPLDQTFVDRMHKKFLQSLERVKKHEA